ncbi:MULTISPECIES: alanine dehydrogenase [unclassified Leucobacter]|uniref:alanine dehydrogenase n=1 Tax=unclassified Leucobacter TaxID=2621730 RepID=UPI00165EB068|nr:MULTISPECIES: alanine dehydrogenase [unclassified Leucobacter]MBC9926486.1 alanine dehydrogenase [Leucobacter sp. cx-169]MBC9937061.1 alanine dehydrogenase [Leucobacter sp. cx-87]
MRVGIPTEIKNNENRVAITEAGVFELARRGHEVLVQAGAGLGSAITDAAYIAAGAKIVDTADQVWADSDMILKVKEPIASEYSKLRKGQILFTYLHLAADQTLTEAVLASGTTAIAYETVQLANRGLPLLAPMSEVAGRLSAQIGAYQLMKPAGGRGVLLGGVTATRKAKTVVIGGGAAGEQAARVAYGMGSDVTIIDIAIPRLKQLEDEFNGGIQTRTSNAHNISEALKDADLVIGSVLIPGEKAPKLVTDEMVAAMKPGSVLVDIAIDQGGCFENSVPTTHDNPTFPVHNSIYYCVANMPGAVPETATAALTNATMPYVVAIADKGWVKALSADEALAKGLNAHEGAITNKGVSDAFPQLAASNVADVLAANA